MFLLAACGGAVRPELVGPGALSTPGVFELNAAFTPDGNTVYFTLANDDFSQNVIYESRRGADGTWGPRRVAPFSSPDGNDGDPFITADGAQLFFMSKRPVAAGDAPRKDWDLWVMAREPGGDSSWGIFIVRDPPGGMGGADLFVSRRGADGWGARRALKAPINSKSWDFCPWVSPDGRWLYFTSSRRGDGDLYRVPLTGALAE